MLNGELRMPDYNTDMRNSVAAHIASQVGGGNLVVLDAANNVLATHNAIPAFPAPASGSTSLTTIPDSTITAGGTATKVRVTKGTVVNEYRANAGEVTFGDPNYVVNGISKVTNITIAFPSGGL